MSGTNTYKLSLSDTNCKQQVWPWHVASVEPSCLFQAKIRYGSRSSLFVVSLFHRCDLINDRVCGLFSTIQIDASDNSKISLESIPTCNCYMRQMVNGTSPLILPFFCLKILDVRFFLNFFILAFDDRILEYFARLKPCLCYCLENEWLVNFIGVGATSFETRRICWRNLWTYFCTLHAFFLDFYQLFYYHLDIIIVMAWSSFLCRGICFVTF